MLNRFTFSKKISHLIIFVGLILVALILDFYGIIWHNDPLASLFKVKGVDVSRYQGTIDWQEVKDTGRYSFVYIKATEGHDYFDDNFKTNLSEAKKQGFLVGAYHFFSLRSSGEAQAKLFMEHVPKDDSLLPPLIDIEIDIEIDTNKDPEKIRSEIQSMSNILAQYYGKKPILYFTYATYNSYLKGYFQDYQVWIRDVFKPPYLSDRNWLFWQYKNRGRVSGIDAYVDINVFNGSLDELKGLTKKEYY